MKTVITKEDLHNWIIFCCQQHDEVCNQKYANHWPYSYHLRMVLSQAERFEKLLSKEEAIITCAGCVGHDLIEDARLTYNDLKDKIGEEVAEIIFLCTEMRGRDRAERKNDEFYRDLVTNRLAVFVKLCDIMANTLHSTLSNSSMLKKARTEWPGIKKWVWAYHPEFGDMVLYLDKIYEL